MRRAVKRASNCLSDARAIERRQAVDGGDRTDLVLDDKAGQAVLDDFGNGAAVVGDDGRTARHRLDHDKTERFGPVDRQQQRRWRR